MRKVIGFILILFLVYALPAFAQQRWERTYGGSQNDDGYSIQQTRDGGYIVGGETSSFGSGLSDVYLIKTDAQGDTIWTRTYTLGGNRYDVGNAIQQTQDGGYIAVGWTEEQHLWPYDVYLIKTNPQGDTVWTKTYGGGGHDNGYDVWQTSDGGYIVLGTTYSYGTSGDFWLIKVDAQGDTLWTRTYGGSLWDFGYSVRQTIDGGYIMAGYTHSFGAGYNDVYLIKTDAQGDTIWTRAYGGGSDDWSYCVKQTRDSGYIAVGTTASFGAGDDDVYLLKTNGSGDTLWTRTYGGVRAERGYSVQQTLEGGYIIAGMTQSFGAGTWDIYLIKTNVSGDILWTKTYGGGYEEYGFSVQQTQDGGYIITGLTNSFGAGNNDVFLIKTDANGSSGIETDRDQGFEGPRVQGFKITPNPFTSFSTVPGHEAERFSLYDVSGRKVGTYTGDRIGEGLAPGVYFISQEGRRQKAEGGLTRIVKIR